MDKYTDKCLTDKTIFASVMEENQKQLRKWGKQTRSLFEWVNYTTEELGELAKAIAEEHYRDGSKEDIYKEAIQVATLALKIAEMVKTDG